MGYWTRQRGPGVREGATLGEVTVEQLFSTEADDYDFGRKETLESIRSQELSRFTKNEGLSLDIPRPCGE